MQRDKLRHSAEGTTWSKKNHKYIRKEGSTYIYPEDIKSEVNNISSDLSKKGYENIETKKNLLTDRKSLEATKSNKYTNNSSDTNATASMPTAYKNRGLTIQQMTKLYGRPTISTKNDGGDSFVKDSNPIDAIGKMKDKYNKIADKTEDKVTGKKKSKRSSESKTKMEVGKQFVDYIFGFKR